MGLIQEISRFFVGLSLLLLLSAAAFTTAKAEEIPASREEISLSFAPLVKKVAPAVVNIYTSKKVQIRTSPFLSDPLFKQFFGDMNLPGRAREKIVNSLGSGVIVGEDGLIITNNHVIEKSDEIKVVLADRREFDAKILLTDTRTDLAMLKIEAGGESLPFVGLENSDSLEVGDLVLAIGNPFGVGQTVTSGIVSAVARTTVGISDFQFFIQTDAAINPGNSGGALVNMRGKLVGVNTAIFSRSGGSHGIGFATPSNMAKVVIASAEQGRVIRPWLGATTQLVTQEIADSLGLKKPAGVLVKDIYPKSTAEKAGLKVGDVLLEIGGQKITDEQALRFRIATYRIGQPVDFLIIRNGDHESLTIEMEAPSEFPPRNTSILTGNHALSGLEVSNISPALAEEMDINTLAGVVVTNIRGRSPARKLGFKIGDIIQSINGQNIASVKQLQHELNKPSASWEIKAKRGNQILSVNIGL